jgi:hypothetical protein
VTHEKGVLPRDREDVPPEAVLDKVRIPFVQKATITHKGQTQEASPSTGLAGVSWSATSRCPSASRSW